MKSFNQITLDADGGVALSCDVSTMLRRLSDKSGRPVLPLQGIFRSGTNYTRTLLEKNYVCNVVYNFYGWKHSFFPIIARGMGPKLNPVRGLVMTKHPLHQLLSLREYAFTNGNNIHCAADREAFLSEPFIIYDTGSRFSTQYYFETPIDYYNSMNWNLLSGCDRAGLANVHVQYEALTQAPEKVATELARVFELEEVGEQGVQLVEHATRNMNDDPDRFQASQDQGTYTSKRKYQVKSWDQIVAYWTQDELDLIRGRISSPLMLNLKYSL